MDTNQPVDAVEEVRVSPPPPSQQKGLWERLLTLLSDSTFSSRFLPQPLRYPFIGYLIAIFLQTAAVIGITLLITAFPTFRFPEAPLILVILLVTLGWGTGPGILATLVGAFLFTFLIIPPTFSFEILYAEDAIGLFLYLITGLAISALTGQTQAAMYLAEHVASERATQLEAILEAIADPLFIVDKHGLKRMNQAARQLFDIPENLQNGQYREDLPPFMLLDEQGEVLPLEQRPQTHILAGEKLFGPTAAEVTMRTHEGKLIFLSVTGSPIREGNGEISSAVLACRDVTQRRLVEQEHVQLLARAQKSEYRFQKLFDANLIGLLVADKDQIIEANNAFLDMVGYSYEDLEASRLRWQTLVPPEYEQINEQTRNNLTIRGESPPFEKEYICKDGTRIPILIGAVTIEQEPLHWISFVLNLSELKHLEKEAKARARELEALFNAITDGIMVYDADGHVRQINTAAHEQLRQYLHPDALNISAYERAEMVKPRSGDGNFLPFQKIPVLRILQGETISGAEAQDVHIQTFTSQDLWLNISGTPLFDEQGQIAGAISIARDVTERRRLEQRTHTALEALLEMAQVIVQGAEQEEANPTNMEMLFRQLMQHLADLTQKVLGCQRLGFTQVMPETELLRPLAVVGLPPEQEAQWWREQEAREVHLSDGADPELLKRLRANEIVLIDLTKPPYNEQPNPYGVRQMLSAPMILGTRLLGFLTLDYGGLDHTYTPEELGLTRAVTKLAALAMERDRLQAEATLARANELAAKEANRLKDEFIGIASHELRTPMTTMKANLQLAERQIRRFQGRYDGEINQAFGQLLGFVERTERQLDRQNRLIRDLLDVSRIESGHLELQLEACDLLTLLQEAIEDQQEITPTRTIHLELPAGEAVLVTADRDRVSQVISNYLSNALKYSEADQPVKVQLEVQNTKAYVSVQDHGPGLSLAEQQPIWNRFYRVPGVVVKSGSGVGLGLGLHISQTIIERQGGQVGVESEPGKGSTFWFTLPLVTS